MFPNKQGWPLRTAGGEVFHSLEEMQGSGNPYMAALAESFLKAREEGERMAAAIFNRRSLGDRTEA